MLRILVAGTGFGCFTHVGALRAAGFDVVALVGRDPEKTAERARIFDVPHASTSYSDAITRADAVSIATPPLTHVPLALEAIAAGKHVLCEKPLARDAAEARTLLTAAESAGIVHLLGTEFRYDTGQALLARAVREGEIGDPKLAMFVLHVPMLAEQEANVPEWWADADAGGGWLGAHGSQVIDQIRVTLGEFESVMASLPHVGARVMSADDAFVVHFQLRSGVHGVMESTAGDRGPLLIETRVVGSRGTAWIEGLGDRVFVGGLNGTRQLDVPDELRTPPPSWSVPPEVFRGTYERMIGHGLDSGPYTRLAEHFLARISGIQPPPGPTPATFADGVVDMTVLDAIRRSVRESRVVTVES